MKKRLIGLTLFAFTLLALPLTALGQSAVLNLLGGESAEISCDGRRLAVSRVDGTTIEVTCRPNQETVTPTPETPTPEPPTPTPEPPPAGSGDTFPEVDPLALGTCSAGVHDRFAVVGPDGNTYRTWHPIAVPIDSNNPGGSTCTFAHEHGDAPHPQAETPPFGYISKLNGSVGMIAAHAGYKCFTHYANDDNGWGRPELDYGGLPIDFSVCVHQGTSGAARLSVQFHDFWFWSQYEGQETLVTVMADTGSGQSLCNGEINGSAEPGRFIVGQDCHVYEQWIFQARVGNAWTSSNSNFAVTNPVTFLSGGGTLSGSLVANCGTNFDQTAPCEVSQIRGGDQFFLGNMRTIHEPDWQWTNAGGEEYFCTDAQGNLAKCGPDTVEQRIATVNLSNASGRILDRTMNSEGFAENQDILWSVGVPGGN